MMIQGQAPLKKRYERSNELNGVTNTRSGISLSKDVYLQIKTFLKDRASLDLLPLRGCLEQRKAAEPLLLNNKASKGRQQLLLDFPLQKENLEAFTKFQNKLIVKGSSSTS